MATGGGLGVRWDLVAARGDRVEVSTCEAVHFGGVGRAGGVGEEEEGEVGVGVLAISY